MFGIKFIKAEPTTYLLQYKKGRVVREGAGLSFFYYAPTSSLVSVPIGTTDVPFIFSEVTADFQEVTASITRWEDWCSAWSARAKIHEALGDKAFADGQALGGLLAAGAAVGVFEGGVCG